MKVYILLRYCKSTGILRVRAVYLDYLNAQIARKRLIKKNTGFFTFHVISKTVKDDKESRDYKHLFFKYIKRG